VKLLYSAMTETTCPVVCAPGKFLLHRGCRCCRAPCCRAAPCASSVERARLGASGRGARALWSTPRAATSPPRGSTFPSSPSESTTTTRRSTPSGFRKATTRLPTRAYPRACPRACPHAYPYPHACPRACPQPPQPPAFPCRAPGQALNLPTCACLLLRVPGTPDDAVRPYTPISEEARLGSFDLLVKRYAG
jgi:hypothetical protein